MDPQIEDQSPESGSDDEDAAGKTAKDAERDETDDEEDDANPTVEMVSFGVLWLRFFRLIYRLFFFSLSYVDGDWRTV